MIMTHDFPFEAIWNTNNLEIPVKITGLAGVFENEQYFLSEGSKTGLPEKQLEDFIYYLYRDENGKEFLTTRLFDFLSKSAKEFYNKEFKNFKLIKKRTLKERVNEIDL